MVDVGCGAGFNSLIAAHMVGKGGRVIGIDMTPETLQKAQGALGVAGLNNVEFREGVAEALPVDDKWADVVTSNEVVNLRPDKLAVQLHPQIKTCHLRTTFSLIKEGAEPHGPAPCIRLPL